MLQCESGSGLTISTRTCWSLDDRGAIVAIGGTLHRITLEVWHWMQMRVQSRTVLLIDSTRYISNAKLSFNCCSKVLSTSSTAMVAEPMREEYAAEMFRDIA